MTISTEKERMELHLLVTDLYDYRDMYAGNVLPLQLLTSDPFQVLIADKSAVTTTHEHAHDNNLQGKLTQIIRRVVEAFDNKLELISPKLVHILELSNKIEAEGMPDACPEDKAVFYYLRARALNILPTQNSVRQTEAKLMLLKALKYHPGFSDAWCELAELEWIEGEPSNAISPLRSALNNDIQHSESLWRLSMLLRQLPKVGKSSLKETLLGADEVVCPALAELLAPLSASGDTASTSSLNSAAEEEKEASATAMAISLRLAHAAVKAAPGSGRAWECLGNALLTAFLQGGAPSSSSCNLIARSLAAFAQAVKDPRVAMEPHFHYNRGVAWHLQDNFAEALTSWFRSAILDPAWPTPQTCATRLINALQRISEEVIAFSPSSNQHDNQPLTNRRQQKRLKELIAPLAPCLLVAAESDSRQRQVLQQQYSMAKLLGPYCKSTDSPGSTGVSVKQMAISLTPNLPKLEFDLFAGLQTGGNVGKVCCGRVISTLPSDSDLAINLLLVDAAASLLVLRICQIGKGSGPSVKDVIAVPDPFIEECSVNHELLDLVLVFNACIRAEGGGIEEESEKEVAHLNNNDSICLRVLRVPIPDVLCVNGRRIGRTWTAPVVLQNVFFTSS